MGGESSYDRLANQITEQQATEQARKDAITASMQDATKLKADSQGLGYGTIGGGLNQYDIARPEFTTMRDPVTGDLSSRFTETMGSANQALLDKAMTTGDTKWAQLQRQGLQDQYNTGMGDLQQQSASGLAQARSNLAMRGGLGSGASERLAGNMATQNMFAQQGLGKNLADANLQVSMQDEATKNSLLQSMGAVQQGIQQGNIGRLQTDVTNQNMYSSNIYGEDMKTYGAIQSGEAQARAAEGGK